MEFLKSEEPEEEKWRTLTVEHVYASYASRSREWLRAVDERESSM